MTKFTDFTLPEPLQRATEKLQFISPTPIQEVTIPWLLDNNQDLIAIAQTGTGKTAAFGLPAISQTDIEKKHVQTLILCPTRELCLQIRKDFEDFSKYMPRVKTAAIYGGAPIFPQKKELKSGVHIVIGTPGRTLDMLKQKVLNLSKLQCLILDEADEMLNMGFKEELFSILDSTPEEKQTLLFSATMPKEVEYIAKTLMKEPHRISVGKKNQGADHIQHFYYKVNAKDKYAALKRIADMSPRIYGIIFCRTRIETQEIANKLQHDGYNADAIHGDLSQGQRELVMNRFRTKYVQLLVATDVAARGIDVDDLTHIINFHIPKEPDMYIHRSGRTGRAGKSGISVSIVHSREMKELKAIEKRLGKEIAYAKVPTGREICEKQLYHFVETVEQIKVDTTQIEPFLPNVYKKLSWLTREELIQRFVSAEFNRFLQYYKDLPDLEIVREKRSQKGDNFKTFRLNIGYTSDLSKRELMRYINKLKVTSSIDIGKIDIAPNFTTVELSAAYEAKLLKAFSKNKYKGKAVSAKVIQPEQHRKRRSKSKRK